MNRRHRRGMSLVDYFAIVGVLTAAFGLSFYMLEHAGYAVGQDAVMTLVWGALAGIGTIVGLFWMFMLVQWEIWNIRGDELLMWGSFIGCIATPPLVVAILGWMKLLS